MANTLLFIGAMLVAFQYVADIGYIGTFLATPFIIPIRPLMTKLGLSIERLSTFQIRHRYQPPSLPNNRFKLFQILLWTLLIIFLLISLALIIVSQPIMFVYLFIGRPLLALNKLLNLIHQKFFVQWQDFYLVGVRDVLAIQKTFLKIEIIKEYYSDEELLEANKKKGELPYIAFLGLLCIIAGFFIQLIESNQPIYFIFPWI